MAEKVGVAPPQYNTQVGRVRAVLGDTVYEEVPPTPPETDPTGLGTYEYFGDAEIEVFLSLSDDLLEGALGLAFNSLATSAAVSAKSVADFDLKISTEKRATELRLLAKEWNDKAAALTGDFFEMLDITSDKPCPPELAASAYYWAGRCGYSI